MRRLKFIIFLSIVFTLECAGPQVKIKPSILPEEYAKLTWQEKLDFFESLKAKKNLNASLEIYTLAFRDSVPAVVIAAINSLSTEQVAEYKEALYQLLKYKNPVVRWNACEKIVANPVDADLVYLATVFSDRDWMVRQCSISSVRNYSNEKSEKKYYFNMIFYLSEVNAQVLQEVYKTLKWYNDERTFNYMYNRMYHASNSVELIIIMRELIEYKNPLVKQRIGYLSNHHRDFFVREEAKRLLDGM